MVFASIGPTGKLLLNEEISTEELRRICRTSSALADAGAVALVVETMSDPKRRRWRGCCSRKWFAVIACMVFDSRQGPTLMGNTPEQVAQVQRSWS